MYSMAEILATRLPSAEAIPGPPRSLSGAAALHNVWGMTSLPAMAALSLGVLALYPVVAFNAAIRLFTKAGTG